ncbi:MAG TPA: hypothetical protein VNI84_00005, partial [Pyrinomonadaceae bacterium]|nr:hypothetical protein [Pyrinomonadaceae bacterium]
MSEHLENSPILRTYLLGQTASEDELIRIEERLLTDAEFFDELEIVEDELIEDYVNDRLGGEESESFRRLFLNVPERSEKIRLTRSLIQLAREEKQKAKSFGLFGRWIFQPQAAFGFLVLCVAVVGLSAWWLIFRQTNAEKSLADLKSIYKTGRPIQARISGFEHSPFVVLRGAEKENKNQLQRRKIELDLSAKAENEPNAENFNRLGLYYLTEKRFDAAAAQFEKGLELNSQNAELRNNLAAGFFEKAKMESDVEKSSYLAKSLDEVNEALKLNPNLLEAVFNKALVLQESKRATEALAVWKQYLEKDAESKWAD